MKKVLYAFGIVAAVSVALAFTTAKDKYFEISKNIEIFTNVYKELNTWYVDDLDPATVMRQGLVAMVDGLDPYTVYYSESEIEGYRYESDSKYDGLGADVRIIGAFPTVVEPYENSPAVKAGLQAGDQILEINGESARGRSEADVDRFMRGVPGTTLKFRIQRPGQKDPFEVEVVRGQVNVPNVPYSGFVKEGIGYVALTTFTPDAGRNIANAVRDFQTEDPDLKGVILDLRGNGGGLLREAVNVSNVFIPKGEEVVSTRGKVMERDQVYSTRNSPIDGDIPLAVLINNTSASASEIVSGVMQDLDRGVLIGQQSYGKGLVQNTREVGYNSRLKITTAKYYIPSGRCIQSVEYANGKPVDIPDEQRAQFSTRNGRTVLDGGGVRPDIVIEKSEPPELLAALKNDHVIFNYVTQFCLEHDSIPDIDEFEFREYDEFLDFVKNSGFSYTSQAEKDLAALRASVAGRDLDKALQNELKSIEKEVQEEKATHFDKYEDEIVREIEMDIAGRYYFENGKTRQRLKRDNELQRAIDLLEDPEEYRKILGG